jgi:hypothetical protein
MMEKYGTLEMSSFLEIFRNKVDPLRKKADELENEIYKINKPRTRMYKIIKN